MSLKLPSELTNIVLQYMSVIDLLNLRRINRYHHRLTTKFLDKKFTALEIIVEYSISIGKFNQWNWQNLSRNPHLSATLIDKYSDQLDWFWLSYDLCPATELIDKYHNRWNWDALSENTNLILTPGLINKYLDYWNWESLSGNPSLSPDMIEEYKHRWNWRRCLRHRKRRPAQRGGVL